MSEQRQPRVPRPVAAASLIFPLTTAIHVGRMLTSSSSRPSGLWARIVILELVVLALAVAYGLWRRIKRALILTAGFSGFSIAYGLVELADIDALWLLRMVGYAATIGLLLVPASSRKWFLDGT